MKEQFIGMNITKSDNKNIAKQYRYFLESNFVVVNILFVLIYLDRDNDVKQRKTRRYYLPKVLSKYNVIISGKKFYDQAIDSNIKR